MVTLATKPTLTGSRVRLRPFREGDLDAVWAMTDDPEGARLTGTHATFTRDAVEHWYRTREEQDDRLDLAVATLDDDACVGEVVLNDLDASNASCAFRISLAGPVVFGLGYGTEATRLLLAHAFDTVGLHRVELAVYAFNERAIRMYDRVGFTVEGVRRQALRWDGTHHDAVMMAMLAPEWHARQQHGAPNSPQRSTLRPSRDKLSVAAAGSQLEARPEGRKRDAVRTSSRGCSR